MFEPMGKQNTRTKSIRDSVKKKQLHENPTVTTEDAVILLFANLAYALQNKISHHLK